MSRWFDAVSPSAHPIRSSSRSETCSRRPMKRIFTPCSCSSGVSDSISSANIAIRPSTSGFGRDQFSVEKA